MISFDVDTSGVMAMLEEKKEAILAAAHRGLIESGQIVKDAAQGICPEDSGNLKRSIHKRTRGLECTVGTNTEYAAYVEFGTCKMAAQPYLIPALLDNRGVIQKTIRDEVKKVL